LIWRPLEKLEVANPEFIDMVDSFGPLVSISLQIGLGSKVFRPHNQGSVSTATHRRETPDARRTERA
jgi:hypothetical protein